MATSESGISWICPRCSRRVPLRVDTCRCGTAKAATAAPAPPLGAPASAQPSAVAAPAFRTEAMGFSEALRSPKEQTLFLIGAIFSSLVWLLLVVSIVGVFYGVMGVVISLVVHALFLAHVRGNALRVSERQLPEIHAAVARSARALGLSEMPEVYVLQAEGALNAFATKFLTRKFIIVYADLIDACGDPRQLEFVIGHEVGHLAAGHLKWNAFLWPFMLVPLLGAAYQRAREYTCDRCGLAVVNDLEMSMRGLIVLAGGRQATRADVPSFMEQRLETGSFWSAVAELGSTHPFLCKRVAALQELSQPGTVAPVHRNPLAYPVAPFLAFGSIAGAGGASLLVMVAVIGIVAAIAIPSLLRARVSANEASALGTVRSVVSAEMAYAQSAGAFGPMPCLVSPATCVTSYQGPTFLSEELASETRGGYQYALRTSEDGRRFVFTAQPVTPGRTGVRGFCGDHTGVVCAGTGGLDDPSQAGCDFRRCRPIGP